MPKKTYRTFYLKSLDVHTQDSRGRRVDVVFKGGIQIDSTARFTTADANVQKALESTSIFNRYFYIESVEEDAPVKVEAPKEEEEVVVASSPEPEKPLTDIKDSARFRNVIEMKNAMKEKGIEFKGNMTYKELKAVAEAAGYDYQIQSRK